MQFVNVINRTNQTLHGVWDGKHVDIKPGKQMMPELAAIAYKRQNPVMGTEDPMTGDCTYKLGIEEHGDPVDPLDDAPEAIEKWNRSKLPNQRPVDIVPGDNGLYSVRSLGSAPLPMDANFDKA